MHGLPGAPSFAPSGPAAPFLLSAATEAPQAAEGSKLPQLDQTTYGGQLFWLAVTFLFLYFVMSRVAVPRIATVIEERRDRILDDLDKAAALKQQAEEAGRAYEKAVADARARARSLAEEARRKVKGETDKLRAEAEAGLAQKLAAAEAQIAARKAQALANVRVIAAETAQAVVQRLIGVHVPLSQVQAVVDGQA